MMIMHERQNTSYEKISSVAQRLGLPFEDVQTAQKLIYDSSTECRRDHLGEPLPRYRYAIEALSGEPTLPRQIIPQFDQLETVLDTLLDAQKNGAAPYGLDHVILPQDARNIPYELFSNDRDLANFFAVSCLWMRRTNSVKAMRALGNLYRDTRELDADPFDPHVAMTMDDESILSMIAPYSQLQMRDFTVPAFRANAKYITEAFGGDVRQCYDQTEDYEEVCRRVKNRTGAARGPSKGLKGFDFKMVSMLLYYLADADSIDRPGEKLMPYFDFPLPVDMHVARLSAGTGCVKLHGYDEGENIMSSELTTILRDMYYDYGVTHGIGQLSIADAVWLMGSWYCSYSPETFSVVKKLDKRKSLIAPYEPRYNHSRDASAWHATCGSCPIAAQCTHVAPGKVAQILGQIILRPRRQSIEQHSLFDNQDQHISAAALDGLVRHAKNRGMHSSQEAKAANRTDNGQPTLFEI